jgi:hypothetical protein
MPRFLAAALLCALAVPAYAVAAAPVSLPTVTTAVTSATTAARACSATAATARGVDAATYRAPMSGYLNVRLKGNGDWDLLLRDAATGRRVGGSQGFGGNELVQTWIDAGQRVTAQACRRNGAAPTASVGFTLVDVKPPASLGARPQLVRVDGTQAQLESLEGLGLDVTHNRHDHWADVIVNGDKQLAALQGTGLPFTTRIADLQAEYARSRAADARYATRLGAAGSPLPSGRTGYRTLEDYQAELKQLVTDHPDLARPVVLGKTFQGREISGVEIARDVNGADGRPTFFLMGEHHAREWPSGEAAMEFATMMVNQRNDPRIAGLLANERVVVVPIVNADGFVSSRGALDPADTAGDPGGVLGLAEAVAPPGGTFAYRRKNCDGEIAGPGVPCELSWGVDNNRNYGNLWGGPGSSSDVTSQSYHGPGPRSEPETQAVWNFARTHQVTFLMTLHTVAALVLRPPGLHDAGLAPDESRMKEIGDAMGKAAGYTSQYSWQLYDTAGTTEDDTYAATGGFGYTIEMGPPGGHFHEPYETGVVNEWTGQNTHSNNSGGLREALLIAAESAANPADHAVIQGTAPAGKVLRLRRAFDTKTSSYCAKGVEPVINLGTPQACVDGPHDPQVMHDTLDSTTVVPAGGSYSWQVGPSTRPFVGGGAVIETLHDIDPPVATFTGAPGQPTGTADHEFTLASGLPADKLRVTLNATLPEDYDIEVFRKQADGSLKSVGTSGNPPGQPEEVILDHPEPGTYVVRVAYFAAATGSYEVKVVRAVVERTVTQGTKEPYVMTCEQPDGTVLEQRNVIVDRGQVVTVDLRCGAAASPLAASAAAKRAAQRTSTRARRLSACRAKARRVKSTPRRAAALRSCTKRYGAARKGVSQRRHR